MGFNIKPEIGVGIGDKHSEGFFGDEGVQVVDVVGIIVVDCGVITPLFRLTFIEVNSIGWIGKDEMNCFRGYIPGNNRGISKEYFRP